MDFTAIFNDALETTSHWLPEGFVEQPINYSWPFLSALLGMLVGALFAARYCRKLAQQSHQAMQQQVQISEKKALDGFLQALQVESKIVFDNYENRIGLEIEQLKEEDPLLRSYPQNSDYFSVYNSNTALIGQVPDPALRLQIVRANTLFKTMLSSLQINAQLHCEYLRLQEKAEASQAPIDASIANKQLKVLRKQGGLLKREHLLTKVQILKMLSLLQAYSQVK
ncbi:MAG: hypothetical protein MJK10_10600 [Pseudomonadales bacterium]|nr:hypothetical protein [Pseudomonadales bacterium]NRA15958.1 hypothetical protein [Oceanospirillaceae bacterium]